MFHPRVRGTRIVLTRSGITRMRWTCLERMGPFVLLPTWYVRARMA